MSVRVSYADWADYSRRFIETVRGMDAADVALPVPYHEAYHAGEINVALKTHGRELFDPWPHADWTIEPAGRGS